MAVITYFEVEDGKRRLLEQPGDVVARTPGGMARELDDAVAPAHRALFDEYLGDLQTAHDIAEPWWAGTIEAQRAQGLDEDDALEAAFTRRAAGAASHPKVVWIVRSYWLQCEEVNGALPPEQRVYPEVFLLKWLIDAGKDDLVTLIACMPYWPMGLDADGNWV
ncbi:hypothetical protein DB30_04603 [Enhygromyxa salina]|uniref:Uncharacterized protein n=1 Tax=Enhygromyxa salina TaxID=215803 RepID=A0A0C2A6V8_9BACT|nr:hypothetical protein [Enhygromyxa salina]KIG19138.1 hypothetical protein DB30_04603 [Enhygromyxa salina]